MITIRALVFNVLRGYVFHLYNINRVGCMLGVVYASWAAKLCPWLGISREAEKDDDNTESSE
jgi:hypothetical protein